MTTLAEALGALEPMDGAGWRGMIPDNWLQGRTAYGGFSTALALHAAKASDTDLPPLRSAQVAFIGPLSGPVMITAHRLRRGRTAAFIQADVESEAGLGLRATFVFMAPLASRIDHQTGSAPDFARPDANTRIYRGLPTVPFTQNFEYVDQREGTSSAEWVRWTRLADRTALDPEVELIAIADALPPAALRLVGEHVPLSSMTWLLNVLAPPATRDGWWLLRAASDYARGGASSQDMAVWDADRRPVASQMQSVALFA